MNNNNGEFVQSLQNLVVEFDAVLRRLKEKDRKLSWQIELLEEKTERVGNEMRDSCSNIILESEFFSFAAEKTIKKHTQNEPPQHKIEELKSKEKVLKAESQSLDLKERELYAKFTHMKEFYSQFISKKTEFELKIPNKSANLKGVTAEQRREEACREKELVLSEKQEKLMKKNEKLQEILKKLNAFYEEKQNYQSESPHGIPNIRSFEPRRSDFRS